MTASARCRAGDKPKAARHNRWASACLGASANQSAKRRKSAARSLRPARRSCSRETACNRRGIAESALQPDTARVATIEDFYRKRLACRRSLTLLRDAPNCSQSRSMTFEPVSSPSGNSWVSHRPMPQRCMAHSGISYTCSRDCLTTPRRLYRMTVGGEAVEAG